MLAFIQLETCGDTPETITVNAASIRALRPLWRLKGGEPVWRGTKVLLGGGIVYEVLESQEAILKKVNEASGCAHEALIEIITAARARGELP